MFIIGIIVVLLLLLLYVSYFKLSNYQAAPTRLVISYDFDNTLKNQYTGEYIKPIVDKMLSDIRAGKEVIICTARMKQHTGEIEEFLRQYNIDVPILTTNRKMKSTTLLDYIGKVGSLVHYDDQLPVIEEILTNIPRSMTYRVLYEKVRPSSRYEDVVVLVKQKPQESY